MIRFRRAIPAFVAVVAIVAGCSAGGGSSKADSSTKGDSSSAAHKSANKKHKTTTTSADSGSADSGTPTSAAAPPSTADMGQLNYNPPSGFTKDATNSNSTKILYVGPNGVAIEIRALNLNGETANKACTDLASGGGGTNVTSPVDLAGHSIPGDMVVGCQDDFTTQGGTPLHQGLIVIVNGQHAYVASLAAPPADYNTYSNPWVDSLGGISFS
ncbi:MAG: hypothetical protein ABI276_00480 [Acidimicrobiales bacterium]